MREEFRSLPMGTFPAMKSLDERAKRKGMFIMPWANNDPTLPEKATFWLVDEATDLPVIVDPVTLEKIDEMLNDLPDKD